MIHSNLINMLQGFFKIALAVGMDLCYLICKFPIHYGGGPIALAVKALSMKALIPTLVGVLVSTLSRAMSYRSANLLGYPSRLRNIRCLDSS